MDRTKARILAGALRSAAIADTGALWYMASAMISVLGGELTDQERDLAKLVENKVSLLARLTEEEWHGNEVS
jgi:hypothetical protein